MSVNATSEQIIPFLVIAIVFALTAVILSIWGGIKSVIYANNNSQNNSLYFQINALLSNLFNCGSCICVAIYCLWLVLYPLSDDDFFLNHESIRLRVATTTSWYAAKIFLFLIFNGRLYFAFKNSKYRSNYRVFKCLNIFVFIHAFISLLIGYIGVLEMRDERVANVGFNTFHFNFAVLLIYLSIQFNRRMFYLSTTKVKIELSRSHGDPEEFIEFSSVTALSIMSNNNNDNNNNHKNNHHILPTDDDDDDVDDVDDEINSNTQPLSINRSIQRVNTRDNSITTESEKRRRRHVYRQDSIVSNREFLKIVTRSTLLLTWIIPFMISISITWTIHRFALNTTHYSMIFALLVMSLDSFIDIICVLLLFKYADPYYNALCKCRYTNIQCPQCGCDYCCNRCCNILARHYVDT